MIDEKLVIAIKNTLSAAAAEILDDILKENAELKKELELVREINLKNDSLIMGQVDFALDSFIEKIKNYVEPPSWQNNYRLCVDFKDIYRVCNEMKYKKSEV